MKRIAVMVVLGLLAVPAAAADKKLYRCGNQYQERPCEASKQSSNAAPAAAPAAGPSAQQMPLRSAAEERRDSQKRIRCENLERERGEMRVKQGATKNSQVAQSFNAQIRALEARMKEEGC